MSLPQETPERPSAEKPVSNLHRTPPPSYHNYSNDQAAEGATCNSSATPLHNIDPAYIHFGKHSAKVDSPSSPSKPTDMSPTNDMLPLVGVTATLPSQKKRAAKDHKPAPIKRSFSRSAEDLSEHMRRSLRSKVGNQYVYSNQTFQMAEEPGSPNKPISEVYSYATAAQEHRAVQMRTKYPGYTKVDKVIRKSMSNPTLLDAPMPGPRPLRPMDLSLANRCNNNNSTNFTSSTSPAHPGSPVIHQFNSITSQQSGSPFTSQAGSPFTSQAGSPFTPQAGSPFTPQAGSLFASPTGSPFTSQPGSPFTSVSSPQTSSPMSVKGINMSSRTRTFTKKKPQASSIGEGPRESGSSQTSMLNTGNNHPSKNNNNDVAETLC